MVTITQRQGEALDFIKLFQAAHGWPPTVREIGEKMGIRSPNGVMSHLRALMKRGLLTRDGRKSRSLRVASTDTVSVDGPDPQRIREAFAPFSAGELRVYVTTLKELLSEKLKTAA